MKKFGLTSLVSVATLVIIFSFGLGTAQSRPQYSKEFGVKYVKSVSTDPNEKAFAEAVATAKCTVCHAGDSKKNRNPFGRELAKLLKPKETDKTKIDEAFDTVLKMKADPTDPNSPTYGELMKQGKLPVGP